MKKPVSDMDFTEGEVLLFDKPKGWTSFDVVKKVRNLIKIKKVGHAGTLDPLATGLLILCTGKKTKTIDAIQEKEKRYIADIRFGATTPSYDAEFPPENIRPTDHLNPEIIEQNIQSFIGTIEQTPPIYSAVKVDGKRAYKSAREGKTVEIKSRKVNIYEFKLLDFSDETAIASIRCSKGTYIRSLAHDLGQKTGTGAYLTDLRRTDIGEYSVENAWQIDDFAAEIQSLKNQENNTRS